MNTVLHSSDGKTHIISGGVKPANGMTNHSTPGKLRLSGVPGLNVVIVTAAGALGVRVTEFALWATIGKALRNRLFLIAGVEAYSAVVG